MYEAGNAMRSVLTAALIGLIAAAPASAQHGGHAASPYAGFEAREIKALSPEDIAELQRGGGWGLALPAELNGMPGPAHLLELADEIGLQPGQRTAIEAMYQAMLDEAIPAGARLIEAERALDAAFAAQSLTDTRLQALLDEAEAARSALRYVHLARHLQTVPLLSDAQIDRYNQLRGYASSPCAAVPDGHDPAVWRRHNGCD